MQKTVKIMSIVLVVAMLMLTFSNVVMGASGVLDKLNPDYDRDDAGITNLGQTLISYISIAAIVIAVIVLTILGIKYMVGSASEKAEYKKTMIPYLIGAVLVFGAGAIAQVIVQMTSSITGAE